MKRSVLIILIIALAVGLSPVFAVAAGSDNITVSLRIEGISENLYYSGDFEVSYTDAATLFDVVACCQQDVAVPSITVAESDEQVRITAVDGLAENSIGGLFNDAWMIRVNGEAADENLAGTTVDNGDEIVLYYGDAELIQYPEMDLSRMITEGIVQFTSEDIITDGENTYVTTNPVAGAIVTWDGMTYKTDASGEIIIDSTGAGVRHTVQIERYYENGMPTVLRFEPEFYIKYGFSDVMPDVWYYDAVMFTSDRALLNGITESKFSPDTAMNRAMFVTVLGRLSEVAVDQTHAVAFADVVNDGWSVGYIVWATSNGIVKGYSDEVFGQYEDITREQIAVILYRYAQYEGFQTALEGQDLPAYPDLGSVSSYAETAVSWAVEQGIINGSDGKLEPGGVATRAQVAAMLQRFITVYYE